MIRLLAGLILLACLAPPAFAGLDAAAVNNAEFKGKLPADDRIDPVIVRAQVLLDRASFSPGEIDGKLGENAEKALKAFVESKGLAVGKQPLTPEIWGALLATGQDPIVVDYKITEKDVKGPFLKKLPCKNGRHEGSEIAGLHQSARGHCRKVSHERSAPGSAQPRQEI
jgi:peptidoglycan hydrolase-like protein with peptidoglycan-binding domain